MRRVKAFNIILGIVVLAEYVGLVLWAKSAFTAGGSSQDFFAGLSFIFGLELVVTVVLSLVSAFVIFLYLSRKVTHNAPQAAMWTLIAILFSPALAVGLLNFDMASGRSSSNTVLAFKYFGGLALPFILAVMFAKLSKRRTLN